MTIALFAAPHSRPLLFQLKFVLFPWVDQWSWTL